MRFTSVIPALALAAGLVNAQTNNKQNGGNNNNNGGGNVLVLNPANVQTTDDGLADAEPGQAASLTDKANFINFCTNKVLTNGLQTQTGSCNGIPMGDIPAKNKMISAAFVEPKFNDVLAASPSPLTFSVQVTNLNAGTFTNPDNTYYAAPQQLGSNGAITGHTHITVQDLQGDINTTDPPDPTVFAFFKGINDDGNGSGLLSADLADGLPPGAYRVCSMTSASNHQPVLMPVAQRGAQDDCVRFTVSDGGNGGGNGGNANGGGNNNGGGNANTGGNGGNAGASSAVAVQSSTAAAQSTATAGGQQQGGKGGQRFGKGGKQRFGRPRKFTAREFVA